MLVDNDKSLHKYCKSLLKYYCEILRRRSVVSLGVVQFIMNCVASLGVCDIFSIVYTYTSAKMTFQN